MNENRYERYGIANAFFNALSLTIPLIMIGAPSWIITIATVFVFLPALTKSDFSLLSLLVVAPLYTLVLRPGLYVWGLVAVINGPQDFVAIAFYIITGLQAFSILKNFIFCLYLIFAGRSN